MMKLIKPGGHRLFEKGFETSQSVSEMLVALKKNGLDAVRKYSRRFDGWDPPDFELSRGSHQPGHRSGF
jgi:sulfopropanediol 3-dehydrogenase